MPGCCDTITDMTSMRVVLIRDGMKHAPLAPERSIEPETGFSFDFIQSISIYNCLYRMVG